VIANPPFSQNYKKSEVTFKERFSHFMPESGKKADYMFVQHMIASLKSDGKMGVVMPHGVLFRGSVEGEFRKHLIKERKILEAVIGLPAGLFYGTGIPAALLIINKAKKDDKVFFINADREYQESKNQNHLRAEDIEKINFVYHNMLEIDAYSRLVTLKEIEAEDFNLNIRRYVDNTPPPEPHDVKAHIHGGVPKVEWNSHLMDSYALSAESLFKHRDENYYIFVDEIAKKSQIREVLESSANFEKTDTMVREIVSSWYEDYQDLIDDESKDIAMLYKEGYALMEKAFEAQEYPVLDRFKIRGIFASWWVKNKFTLKSIKSSGYNYNLLSDAYLTGSLFFAEQLDVDQEALVQKLKELLKKLKSAKEESDKAVLRDKIADIKEELFESVDDVKALVEDMLKSDALSLADRYLSEKKQAIIADIEKLWDKYHVSLAQIEKERDEATKEIKDFLTELGYQ
jgi:type I restriction enzyme M protein